jgi:hypothetical protein
MSKQSVRTLSNWTRRAALRNGTLSPARPACRNGVPDTREHDAASVLEYIQVCYLKYIYILQQRVLCVLSDSCVTRRWHMHINSFKHVDNYPRIHSCLPYTQLLHAVFL